ncbi:MAG TPA: sigma-70 family RNA polymerase sigma factor [Opitutaceae bacterium]|nr:sigma-70 family RNA polymerase sigma factor [Opitutaceae bacterium]
MLDDATLLQRYARDRSQEAFAELVQRHLALVYSAALRRMNGDAHRAQDVAQIVFATLARDAARLSRHAALAGWLYAATRNAAIDLIRTERRRQQREEKAHAMEEIFNSPEAPADWEQLRPVLDEAMDQLDDRDREAVLLRFFEGRPFGAVALTLRVSEEAARKRVDRALAKLGTLLARRGITSTGGALALLLANQPAVAVPAGVANAIAAAATAGVAGAAGAGTIGAGTTGIFIMSTTKAVTGIAAVVALAAIGSALYEARSARESADALASANAQRASLQSQVAALEQRARQADEKLDATEKELANAKAAAAQPAPAAITRPPASQSGPAMDYVLEHPETHAAFLQQQGLRVQAHYAGYLQTPGLTAAQKEQFLQKMEQAAADEFDFMTALHTHGFGVGNLPKDAAGQELFQQLLADKQARSRELQAGVKELLGADGFRQFQQYSATIPERNVAEQIAGRLYQSDAPLTAAQADRLMQVLAQNRYAPQPTPSPRNTIGGTFVGPDAFKARVGQAMQQGGMTMLDWPAPITDAALTQAGTVLSPDQLAVLRQVQAQQLTQFLLAPPAPAASGQ